MSRFIREALAVSVTAGDGFIYIAQENPDREDEDVIEIHAGQVDMLIDWLHDARVAVERGDA